MGQNSDWAVEQFCSLLALFSRFAPLCALLGKAGGWLIALFSYIWNAACLPDAQAALGE